MSLRSHAQHCWPKNTTETAEPPLWQDDEEEAAFRVASRVGSEDAWQFLAPEGRPVWPPGAASSIAAALMHADGNESVTSGDSVDFQDAASHTGLLTCHVTPCHLQCIAR